MFNCGAGDMPLECLRRDRCKPGEERVVRGRNGESRRQLAGEIETLCLAAQELGRTLRVPVFSDLRRWSEHAAARQQTGRQVPLIGVQKIARWHFPRGAKHFLFTEQHAPVFGLPGDAQLAAPSMGKKPQR
jgi:hypothetical protein